MYLCTCVPVYLHVACMISCPVLNSITFLCRLSKLEIHENQAAASGFYIARYGELHFQVRRQYLPGTLAFLYVWLIASSEQLLLDSTQICLGLVPDLVCLLEYNSNWLRDRFKLYRWSCKSAWGNCGALGTYRNCTYISSPLPDSNVSSCKLSFSGKSFVPAWISVPKSIQSALNVAVLTLRHLTGSGPTLLYCGRSLNHANLMLPLREPAHEKCPGVHSRPDQPLLSRRPSDEDLPGSRGRSSVSQWLQGAATLPLILADGAHVYPWLKNTLIWKPTVENPADTPPMIVGLRRSSLQDSRSISLCCLFWKICRML